MASPAARHRQPARRGHGARHRAKVGLPRPRSDRHRRHLCADRGRSRTADTLFAPDRGCLGRGREHVKIRLPRRLSMPDRQLARRWALTAFLILALIGSAFAVFTLLNGVDLRTLEQHRADSDTVNLDARQIAQSFRTSRDNLSAVDIELGTIVSRVLPADGQIRLIRGDAITGTVVYQAPLNTAIDQNPYLRINFPPVAGSRDLTYTLVLDLPRPLKTAIGVHYNSFDALSSGQMYVDGRPAQGDIAMNAYYRYDLAALRADIRDTLTTRSWMPLSWLALLLLPGLALLLWLPNGLTTGQRLLAAPGLSVLSLPV